MHMTKIFMGSLLSAVLGGALFGATPNQITTASGPIGVAATTSQLLFTQPFCSTSATLPVQRGVWSVNTTTGVATIYAPIPLPSTTIGGLFCAEMYIALAQTGNIGGFPAGTAYVTQGDVIYKVPPGGGSASPLALTPANAITGSAPFGHSGIQFDTQGAFGGRLIYTSSAGIWAIDSAGVATKLANGPAPGTRVYLESPSVSPAGVLYVVVEDDTVAAGRGPLSGIAKLVGGTLIRVIDTSLATGLVKSSPESINFVPASPCSLTIAGTTYGAFLSVFSKATAGSVQPADSAVDGFLSTDVNAQANKAIVTFEYSQTSGFSNGDDVLLFTPDALAGTFGVINTQLEGFNLVTCNVPPPPGGCPATQGFWHKASNWPVVAAPVNVDGAIYNPNFSITIGGINYTQAQLLDVLPSGSLHSGNYANSLSQFIAAVVNVAAGAQHTVSGDAAISSDNTALTGVPIFCGSSLCSVSSSVSSVIQGNLSALDNYNSAVGLNCTEGTGLNTGQ